ncbi:hypothetical protein [Paraclostridium bifermentans]|uniref:hypothetical protein n=1 Tax=Paraclostridium bifermentans TaxID=1490 RepID=UPI00387AECC7
MAKYRKKPVVIDAIQLGVDDVLPDWVMDRITSNDIILHNENPSGRGLDTVYAEIKTLEGIMVANNKDYIIKGVKGEVYPCKPEIFEMTYEKAD